VLYLHDNALDSGAESDEEGEGTDSDFHGTALDRGLQAEINRFLAVNRALVTKLLAVLMSMHARLGAGSGLRVLDDNLVTMICDVLHRESKASSLLDEWDVEKGESDSGSESEEEDGVQGEDSDGWGQ
jgi:hypothetical protein